MFMLVYFDYSLSVGYKLIFINIEQTMKVGDVWGTDRKYKFRLSTIDHDYDDKLNFDMELLVSKPEDVDGVENIDVRRMFLGYPSNFFPSIFIAAGMVHSLCDNIILKANKW